MLAARPQSQRIQLASSPPSHVQAVEAGVGFARLRLLVGRSLEREYLSWRQTAAYCSVAHPVSAPAALPRHGRGVYAGGPVPETGRLLLVEDTTSFPFSAIGAVVFLTNEDS